MLLGAVGLIVPVWPTTPFVLLSIWCFSSMPKIRSKILSISFFRQYYESYTKGSGLSKKTVAASLVFLWSMLIISMLMSKKLFAAIILSTIGVAVTIHIIMIAKKKTKAYNEEKQYEK